MQEGNSLTIDISVKAGSEYETRAEAGISHVLEHYYIKCAPQFAQISLELLADMMLDAQFAIEELEREKGVIIQELKMYEDNPMSLVNEKWSSFFF